MEYHGQLHQISPGDQFKKTGYVESGLIKHSIFLIWFEDIALTDYCETIIPAIFSIFVAFMYYISPNRKYSMLLKEEFFDYNTFFRTEISSKQLILSVSLHRRVPAHVMGHSCHYQKDKHQKSKILRCSPFKLFPRSVLARGRVAPLSSSASHKSPCASPDRLFNPPCPP